MPTHAGACTHASSPQPWLWHTAAHAAPATGITRRTRYELMNNNATLLVQRVASDDEGFRVGATHSARTSSNIRPNTLQIGNWRMVSNHIFIGVKNTQGMKQGGTRSHPSRWNMFYRPNFARRTIIPPVSSPRADTAELGSIS